MYLHAGRDFILNTRDIIGIFDMDNTTSSHLTRRFLAQAEREGRVVDVSGDLPKSFALCRAREGPAVVYLSQLSAATLRGRVESGTFE